jgi:hypothetical protein
LKVDLDELIVFQYRYFRLMAIGPNHQLLTHDSPPFWADDESSAISGFALRLQPAYPADRLKLLVVNNPNPKTRMESLALYTPKPQR